MAVSYRSLYSRWGNTDRGADDQAVTTVAGDTVLCLWFHPWGNNVYFRWDDVTFPNYGYSGTFEYGAVKPSAGAHNIDAYCDNGGPNLLVALLLTGAIPSITGASIYGVDPTYSGLSTNVVTARGGMVGCLGMMGWFSDAWGYDVSWQGGETEICGYGGNYANAVCIGGYEAAASVSPTNVDLDTYWTMGDPDAAYVMGVGIRPYVSGSGVAVILERWRGFLDDLRRARIPPELLLRRYREAVQI